MIAAAGLAAQNTGSARASQPAKKLPPLEPSYAWRIIEPLGLREPATIDTLPDNYGQRSVPSAQSAAYATTGNLGAEGINMIWTERPARSDFFFRDAIEPWIPTVKTMRFYNTRQPMTLLSYNASGGRDNAQERLAAVFSGNINSKAQIGALLDYIYSKGCYANQAAKNLTWGLSGSYMGDRYEMQAYFNHFNSVNKENGGITDPLYITDPALVQGGVTSVDVKTIPTRLSNAHTRISGQQLLVNNRYKIGFWDEQRDENDSIVKRTYVPVTSLIYTLKFTSGKHTFRNTSTQEMADFFDIFRHCVNDIPLHDLLVVNIIQQLDFWTAHFLNQRKALCAARQIIALMVYVCIKRLHNERNPSRF